MSGSPLKPKAHHEDHEDWLLTFADMVVILMCFFIMLFALTYMPKEQQKSFIESLKATGFSEKATSEDPYEKLAKDVMELNSQGYDQFLFVTENKGKLEIELASSSFFASGAAQFKKDALPVLEAIAQKLVPMSEESKVNIFVEGHTDNAPISTPQFPSNWELSGARASNVVRFLIAKGVAPSELGAVGYAEARPKAENEDSTGTPIPANQELNRRVVIKVEKAN